MSLLSRYGENERGWASLPYGTRLALRRELTESDAETQRAAAEEDRRCIDAQWAFIDGVVNPGGRR